MVLYMVVASRPSEGSDGNELRNRVKANLSAGDIHYGKGNYSYALRYYVTALKLSEAAKGHPYLAVLYKNMGNVYSMFLVNEYRINLACERLADREGFGQYSMNGIGESVGFRSSATFTTVFKKITGITPSVYQKLTRENRNKAAKQGKELVIHES